MLQTIFCRFGVKSHICLTLHLRTKLPYRHITPTKLQRASLLACFLAGLFDCHSHAQVNYDPFNPSPPTRMGTNAQDVMNRANTAQSGETISQQEKQQQVEEAKRDVIKPQPVPKTVVKTTAPATATPRPRPVLYDLPTRSDEQETVGYHTALNRMLQMAGDSSQFSLSEAVFVTEMAFFNEQGDYAEFQHGLELIAMFLEKQMRLHGYDPENNLSKNLMLYRLFTDTLRNPDGSIYHLPYKYDFIDYRGDEDWTKMFVLKLLHQNSGQCHSLPLLYLILAELIEAEAYLAYAPEHTYVKFPLPNGGFQNVELTSQALTTNAHVMQSGYIEAEALQNRLYMQPLNQKELLSHCMTDLAQGYKWKFGYDPFVKQVIDKALELAPNNMHAHLLLSDYYTLRFQFVMEQIGETEPTLEQWLRRYPEGAKLFRQMEAKYNEVDALGYSDMPEEAYEEWLKYMADEKTKQESQQLLLRMEKSLHD